MFPINFVLISWNPPSNLLIAMVCYVQKTIGSNLKPQPHRNSGTLIIITIIDYSHSHDIKLASLRWSLRLQLFLWLVGNKLCNIIQDLRDIVTAWIWYHLNDVLANVLYLFALYLSSNFCWPSSAAVSVSLMSSWSNVGPVETFSDTK